MKVTFKRERSAGLKMGAVYIEGKRLEFRSDRATADLEVGKTYDISWRMFGNTGAKLTVKVTAEGAEKTVVESELEAKDKGRKSDSTDFKI